ncbi:MAG: RNase adapter RapZ [Peptococcaceae bacterium]|jgi:UPF0042 nucleotide-binding protein|nr:RNase adapter RapZ [Peptococcaceae bacterium]
MSRQNNPPAGEEPIGPDKSADIMDVWIITGQSGAGKTNVLRILEDWGYFCIDNLPPALLAKTAQMLREAGDVKQVALGVDVRSRRFFDSLLPALSEMALVDGRPRILFLDADTATLVKRFKETRRRHPMASEGMLLDDIQMERKRLESMRERADIIIDTTSLKPKELKEVLERRIFLGQGKNQFQVQIVSFGFKYGVPWDADLLMDVRFLPNPHYIPALRPFTGLDAPVRDYVMGHEVSQVFFEKFSQMLLYLIPKYIEEGKSSLVVAIGCTGGQHRSVTLAEKLYASLLAASVNAAVSHRDIARGKESQ